MQSGGKSNFRNGAGWQAARQHLVQPASLVQRPVQLKPVVQALRISQAPIPPVDRARVAQLRFECKQNRPSGIRPSVEERAPRSSVDSHQFEQFRAQFLKSARNS